MSSTSGFLQVLSVICIVASVCHSGIIFTFAPKSMSKFPTSILPIEICKTLLENLFLMTELEIEKD